MNEIAELKKEGLFTGAFKIRGGIGQLCSHEIRIVKILKQNWLVSWMLPVVGSVELNILI